MSGSTRHSDNFNSASLDFIKEGSSDYFGQSYQQMTDGWNAKRLAEIGIVDPSGARPIARDKEYGMRPKVAKWNHEQINYRHFADGPDSGHQSQDNSVATTGLGGDNPGDPVGTVGVGIPPVGGGSGDQMSWDVPANDVGFEMSLVSDIFGAQKSAPDWNPSHMNGQNRSTLILSRREKDEDDRGDDLPHRYFSRTSDLFVPVATNDVELKRKRYNGGSVSPGNGADAGTGWGNNPGDPVGTIGVGIIGSPKGGGTTSGADFFETSGKSQDYHDGIWKTALNVTRTENPLSNEAVYTKQLDEYSSGPGKRGWSLLPAVDGFPHFDDLGGDEFAPSNWPQGGWLYDAEQNVLGNLNELIGIDGWKVDDAMLPRYRNKHKQRVSIAFIRHDAHFMKKGDSSSPPPKGTGGRLSGRIYFTKDFQCPGASVATGGGGTADVLNPNAPFPPPVATGGGQAGGTTDNGGGGPPSDNQDVGTPVCGEMVLDVSKADDPASLIRHESGEWRPMIMAGGGGGGDKYDYSYHSKPKKSGSGTTGQGSPTPMGQTYQGSSTTPGQTGYEAVPSTGTPTAQTQMGSPPPESPGNSQNVNIFENIQAPSVVNPAAVFTITKPKGYRTLKMITWIRAADEIPDGQKIEINIIAGEYALDDRGPQQFYRAPIILTNKTFQPDKRWRRIVNRWNMFDPTFSHPITVWVERRNDLSNVDSEVWILKHGISFEP